MINIDELKFDERGLIPAVVVDSVTKRVLTLAYMSRESLAITMERGLTCFFSRSRGELWLKGETSGNYQHIVSITADCDGDALVVMLRAMEHSALEAPGYLPVKISASGGISGGVATAEQLGKLGRYVERLLHRIAAELRSGNIDADPCSRGPQESACTYCEFASACYFEDGRGGDRMRYLKKTEPEEFWQFVDRETGEEVSHGENTVD